MEKRGKLVLLNSMKNFYEKCYVKIDEKKHTSTNNLSNKNDSIDWKLIWWKLDKIGLELVKNMRRFEKKKCGSRSCNWWTTNIEENFWNCKAQKAATSTTTRRQRTKELFTEIMLRFALLQFSLHFFTSVEDLLCIFILGN